MKEYKHYTISLDMYYDNRFKCWVLMSDDGKSVFIKKRKLGGFVDKLISLSGDLEQVFRLGYCERLSFDYAKKFNNTK